MSAVVLAGEREGSIPVMGRNKALLTFRGRPLVAWVAEALDRAQRIDSITIVGPRAELAAEMSPFSFSKPVQFVDQGSNIFENMWQGARAARGGGEEDFPDDWPVLELTCDVPLLKSREVDHFVATAPLDRADLVFGVTRRELLAPYEPGNGQPGIKFNYICLNDYALRHANLFCFRPARLAFLMQVYVPLVYRLRYQRRLGNVWEACKAACRLSLTVRALYAFWRFQAASYCYNHDLPRLCRLLRWRLELGWAEEVAGAAIQTRFAVHETIGPGTTLDVDDDPSYHTFLAMYDRWEELQRRQLDQA